MHIKNYIEARTTESQQHLIKAVAAGVGGAALFAAEVVYQHKTDFEMPSMVRGVLAPAALLSIAAIEHDAYKATKDQPIINY